MFLGLKSFKPHLLYQATRDGFSYQGYINNVLNKRNLLSVIKSEYGKVFGCYYSIPRTQSVKWEIDEEAFIFSLTHS